MMNLAQAHAWIQAQIPQARLVGDGQTAIARVHSDTRSLQAGDLFVALKGERFDANDFLPQARAAGALAALAHTGLETAGLAGIEVPDTLVAFGALAHGWRAQYALSLIAVTGSNGKTTVTQMLASILQAAAGDAALATRGNLNNAIGVPQTLLRLSAQHRLAVVELGMNHPGEIAYLAAIAQPTVALVNNAQREHLEFMQTVDAVARENGSVLAALPADGVAVFPAGDAYTPLWRALAGARRCLTFAGALSPSPQPSPQRAEGANTQPDSAQRGEGVNAESNSAREDEGVNTEPNSVRRGEGANIAADLLPLPLGEGGGEGGADVYCTCAHWQGAAWARRIATPGGALDVSLHIAGRHNISNALAATACALAAGVSLQDIAQGLSAFTPVTGRSRAQLLQWQGRSLTLVDDSYNANPDSVQAAIAVLADLPAPRLLVLGDMGEVGDQGAQLHAEAGAQARAAGIEHCWVLGALSQHAANAYGAGAQHFSDMPALLAALAPQLAQVGSVLVKGSRFMRMEQVVQAVQGIAADREGAACC